MLGYILRLSRHGKWRSCALHSSLPLPLTHTARTHALYRTVTSIRSVASDPQSLRSSSFSTSSSSSPSSSFSHGSVLRPSFLKFLPYRSMSSSSSETTAPTATTKEKKDKDEPDRIHLKDYKPPPIIAEKIDLYFDIHETETIVTTTLSLSLNPSRDKSDENPLSLSLHGDRTLSLLSAKWVDSRSGEEGEELVGSDSLSLSLDGSLLSLSLPTLSPSSPPGEWTLRTRVCINPSSNTQLEGLYLSNGNFVTQCEAQGRSLSLSLSLSLSVSVSLLLSPYSPLSLSSPSLITLSHHPLSSPSLITLSPRPLSSLTLHLSLTSLSLSNSLISLSLSHTFRFPSYYIQPRSTRRDVYFYYNN